MPHCEEKKILKNSLYALFGEFSLRTCLYCLKSLTGYLDCALMATFLLFLFIISMSSDSMPLLFVSKADLSLSVRKL